MKKLLKFSALLTFLILLFSFNSTKKVIVIDAGHGGIDKGATKENIQEKDITLAIAQKIKQLNKNNDIEIVLTRDNDSYPSLSDRSKAINNLKPAMVLSLHVNMAMKNTEKTGTEIYTQNSEHSKKLAQKLSEKLGNSVISEKNLFLLRNSEPPTILLELGFLNNQKDREYLASKNGQNEMANKILDFIYEN